MSSYLVGFVRLRLHTAEAVRTTGFGVIRRQPRPESSPLPVEANHERMRTSAAPYLAALWVVMDQSAPAVIPQLFPGPTLTSAQDSREADRTPTSRTRKGGHPTEQATLPEVGPQRENAEAHGSQRDSDRGRNKE